MLFRKDLNAIQSFESDVYPEDYDLVFRMYDHGLKIIPCTDEVLHLWRDHGGRASRNDDNYKDNRFLKLKVRYFIEIEIQDNHTLILWGAGNKAKIIAKSLINSNIEFQWMTNNINKIGHNIYGKILRSTSDLIHIESAQLILTVANPSEQDQIKKQLKSLSKTSNLKSYWFC